MDRGARVARAHGAAPGVGPWELRAPAALPSPDGGMAADRRLAPAARRVLRGVLFAKVSGRSSSPIGPGSPRPTRRSTSRTPRPPPSASPGRSARTARSPPSGRPDGALPPADPLPAGPCLFWIAFLFYAFLAAYVTTALSTAGDERLPAQYAESLRRPGPRDPEQRRGPGLRALLLGPRKPGDVDALGHRLPHALAARVRARLDPPARVSARRSPRRDPHHRPLRPLWGSRSTGCVGTSASRRSPPSGGGSWSCSRRRSWSTRPRVPGDSGALATVVGARALLRLPHGAGRRWRS